MTKIPMNHIPWFLFARCNTLKTKQRISSLFTSFYYINHLRLEPHQFCLACISRFHFHLLFLVFTPTILVDVQDLANYQEKNLEESENKNQRVVLALYEALSSRDVGTVHQILAAELEWWFHGPPSHQFMMHLLTGASSSSDHNSFEFKFVPLSVTSFGSIVITEGCDHCRRISWVHAWTVANGVITQVREYLNTSLTVTLVGNLPSQSESKQSPPSDFPSKVETNPVHCPSVWESSLSNLVGKSVPGLLLAI